jgi:hypothetical protein
VSKPMSTANPSAKRTQWIRYVHWCCNEWL